MSPGSAEGGPARPTNPWTPSRLAEAGPLAWAGVNIATLLLYFALGSVVNWFFAAYGLFPAPIWLPTGIAMVAAMIGDVRVLPGIFLGSFLTNDVLFHAPLYITTIISTTNALGPVIGAVALRHLRPQRGLFTSFPGVIAFIICTSFLSPSISATGGAVAMTLGQPFAVPKFYSIWVNWWLTDGGGTLYLAPAIILWLALEREPELQSKRGKAGFERRDLAIWGWSALVSLGLFVTPPLHGTDIRAAFPFLLVVPLSWIALRMSLRSAYTLISLVAVVATTGTVAGYGPFQNHALANPLQLVGTLVVLLAMNVLTIVALVSERHEAENANRVKSMFLANTSHELRTPLNAIIGFSSLINEQAGGGMLSATYAGYAEMIQASGEHLLALINDLMEMSKIEAGRFDLNEEPFPFGPLVEQVSDLIRLQAEKKSVTLSCELACGDVIVDADAKAWRQILLNLLSNAVKFTPQGGAVGIAVRLSPRGDLLMSIRDTGIGIPAEALERVFAPFERAHRDTAPEIEGTGLGLAITRGLVTLHGGTIALDSLVGAGTTVTVTLPARRVIAGAAAAPRLLAAS